MRIVLLWAAALIMNGGIFYERLDNVVLVASEKNSGTDNL